MAEHITQMVPMLILAGILAGWMAEVVSRADGYGFMPDVALGLIGSLVGGAAVWFLVSRDAGMLEMWFIGMAGAAVVITAQRGLWRSLRPGA